MIRHVDKGICLCLIIIICIHDCRVCPKTALIGLFWIRLRQKLYQVIRILLASVTDKGTSHSFRHNLIVRSFYSATFDHFI